MGGQIFNKNETKAKGENNLVVVVVVVVVAVDADHLLATFGYNKTSVCKQSRSMLWKVILRFSSFIVVGGEKKNTLLIAFDGVAKPNKKFLSNSDVIFHHSLSDPFVRL